MQKFKVDTILYSSKDTGTAVFRDELTIGYIFINTGNCAIYLNNYLLQPNSTFKTFEPDCCDCTLYRMTFNPFNTCSIDNSELTVIIYNKA
jgi:hypothetical protein